MLKTLLWGRVLTGFVGVYHLLGGLCLLASGDLSIRLAKTFGGMQISGSPELGILGEILGCYLIAFGVLMLAVAWDPVANRVALPVALVLFLLRIGQRLVYGGKVMEVFHVPASRHWMALALVVALSAGLMVFWLQIRRVAK